MGLLDLLTVAAFWLLLAFLIALFVAVVRLVHPLSLLRTREHRLVHDDHLRTYLLHLPPGYDGRRRLPLVVMLHPRGDYARQFEVYSQMSHHADRHGFAVVYPNGTRSESDRARSWNAGSCCGYPLQVDLDDVGFIGRLLDELLAGYALDPGRVFVAGWSNGGMLAHRVGAVLTERLAGVAAINASVGGSASDDHPYFTIPAPRAPLPVLMVHGERDTIVPYGGGRNATGSTFTAFAESVAFWVRANGCQPRPRHDVLPVRAVRQTTYESAPPNSSRRVVACTVPDGAHVFFGGLQELRDHFGTRRFSAAAHISEFFAACPDRVPNAGSRSCSPE